MDVHNHLWQSLIRGCGTSLAVGEWLRTCVFPVGGLNVTADGSLHGRPPEHPGRALHWGDHSCRLESRLHSDFTRGNVQALLDSGLRFAFAYLGRVERVADMRR